MYTLYNFYINGMDTDTIFEKYEDNWINRVMVKVEREEKRLNRISDKKPKEFYGKCRKEINSLMS